MRRIHEAMNCRNIREQIIAKELIVGARVCTTRITPDFVRFDIRAQYKCRSCPHFGKLWTCPPNVGDMRYFRRLVNSYTYGFLVVALYPYTAETYEEVREQSARQVQGAMISLEKYCFSQNKPWVTSFVGGSCRLCETCAAPEGPCRLPESARPAMEGAGIDVIETCRRAGAYLPSYPHPEEERGVMARVGLLMVE